MAKVVIVKDAVKIAASHPAIDATSSINDLEGDTIVPSANWVMPLWISYPETAYNHQGMCMVVHIV